jgi:hypothetical protein
MNRDGMNQDIENRIVDPVLNEEIVGEATGEKSLRPSILTEYVGQKKAKENLSLFMEAAKQRGDSLDHFLPDLRASVRRLLHTSSLTRWEATSTRLPVRTSRKKAISLRF